MPRRNRKREMEQAGNNIIALINTMHDHTLNLQQQLVSCKNRVHSLELKVDTLIIQRGGVPGFPRDHPVNQPAHGPAQGPGFPPFYPVNQPAHGPAQGPVEDLKQRPPQG